MSKEPCLMYEGTAWTAGFPGGHAEGFPDAIKNNFRAIYSSIGNNSEPVEYATFESGLRQMIICDKIIKSAKEEKWVRL